MSKFRGQIKLSPVDPDIRCITVEFDKDETELVYDEIFDAISEKMDEQYPETYYPCAEISEIFIENDGHLYPVVDDESKVNEYENAYDKVLVLPCYTYSLSKEYKLYMKLIDEGILPINAKFDYDKMHTLINTTQS